MPLRSLATLAFSAGALAVLAACTPTGGGPASPSMPTQPFAVTRVDISPMTTASLHHFLYRSEYYWDDTERDPDFFAARAARRTWIGHDTWIGHGAIVKPEIRIGHGAIVAAGAVVTHDVPDWMIVAGCPARPLRRRFPEEIGARLIRLAWWDWDHDRLRQALPDFRSLPVVEFLDRYES